MAILRLFDPTTQFQTKSGSLNVAGKLRIYVESTDDLANIYGDDGSLLSQPLILDSNGRARGLFVDSGRSYRLEAYDRNDSLLFTIRRMEPNASGTIVNPPTVFIKGTPDEINVEDSVTDETRTYTVSLSAKVTGKIAENQEAIVKESEARKGADDELRKMIDDSSKVEAGTASPLMAGTASVGNSLKYAREDHVHPSDTSREDIANKTTVVLGTSDSKYPTDKAVAEFVNSSIATNTANYISNNGEPFTSVEQLEAYSGPVTNNDYAFVTGMDSEGNTYYDRYKATVSGETVTWALEYRLNNSSFTAAQWSAINSGITSELVAKIHDHSNKDVLDGITSTDVANWNSKMDRQTVGNVSEPIYLENGIAKECNSSNLKAGKDDDGNVIKNTYQKKLTFDTTPTAGSTNPVTSNGIRTMKPISHRFDNENLSRLIVWGKANSKGYINDIVRKFGLKYGSITDLLFTNSVHKDNTTSVIIKILNDSGILTASTRRLKASIFKDSSENSYFALWLDGSISQPGWAYYVDYYPDVSEEDSTVSRFTVFNPSEYTLVRDLTIKYIALALPIPSEGVLTSDGKSNSWSSVLPLEKGGTGASNASTARTNLSVPSKEDFESHTGNETVHITAAERTAWNAKQASLTFDTTPTASSTNPVTSDGIKTAIDSVNAKGLTVKKISGEQVICFE